MRIANARSLAVAAFVMLAAPFIAIAQDATPETAPAGPAIISVFTLPDTPLSHYQNSLLPDYAIENDRGFLLGGIGSDMYHVPGDPDDIFWLVTDRGPNTDFVTPDGTLLTFPVPDFTPTILQVRIVDESIEVLKAVPIVGQSGAPVTGLGNIDGKDNPPYSYDGEILFDFNPNGLDPEGLVVTADGDFWLSEEYSPSILHVGADGKVIARYTPEGVTLEGADYEVIDSLPALYHQRRSNRGFEGLAISGDGSTLFATLQSPLFNPDAAVGRSTRNTRILAFDIATGQPVAEYIYEFEDVNEFDPSAEGAVDLMKLSGIAWIDATRLLVLERTDPVAKLYIVDISGATNILETEWDDPATSPSLEQITDFAAAGLVALPKTLLVDLDSLGDMPDKIEGIAIINSTTIAVVNDNDFDVNAYDAEGNTIPTGKSSQILIISVPEI